MGGTGSGAYYHFNSKDRAEDHLSVDVRRWYRGGFLEPYSAFTASWRRYLGESSISVLVLGTPGEPADEVRLSYSWELPGEQKEDVAYGVPLEWTVCNFGSSRPWFVCPGRSCGRRAALLYLGGRYFLCRRCQRIRTKLGGSANMTEPFPDKPKGMHWKTYWRLYDRHETAHAQYIQR